MGSDVISFNVEDSWIILRVAWVCGYDCVRLYEYGIRFVFGMLPEVTEVLSGGIIQAGDDGGLHLHVARENGEK